jgi:hypothetical protein
LNGYSTTCPLQQLRQAGCGKSTRTVGPGEAEHAGGAVEPRRNTAWGWDARFFDAGATHAPIETLRGSVLLEHPQKQGPARRSLGNGPGNTGQQRPTDATPPTVVGDVQVLDEAAPPVVVVEEDVPEAHQPGMVLNDDGRAVGWEGEPGGPDRP